MSKAPRILLVEDEEAMIAGLEYALKKEGFHLTTARDGEIADGLLARGKFDLVILDLMLPKRSGFDVLRTFRVGDSETPVLLLTAKGQEVDKVRGFDLGADDYVTKPFGLAELLARIRARLRARGGTEEMPDLLVLGDTVIDLKDLSVNKGGASDPISVREADMLRLLYRNRGQTVPRRRVPSRGLGPRAPAGDAHRRPAHGEAPAEGGGRPREPAPHPHRRRPRLPPREVGGTGAPQVRRRPAGGRRGGYYWETVVSPPNLFLPVRPPAAGACSSKPDRWRRKGLRAPVRGRDVIRSVGAMLVRTDRPLQVGDPRQASACSGKTIGLRRARRSTLEFRKTAAPSEFRQRACPNASEAAACRRSAQRRRLARAQLCVISTAEVARPGHLGSSARSCA